MAEIGEVIASIRGQRRMTQTELAKRVGVRPATVSEWESGKMQPSRANIGAVAAALGVSYDELLAGAAAVAIGVGRAVREGTPSSRSRERTRRAEQFEREMIRLGANDYEADHVRVRARAFLESVLSSGGTEDAPDEDALDREFDIYLQNSLKLWVLDQMKRRGATPNVLGDHHKDGRGRGH